MRLGAVDGAVAATRMAVARGPVQVLGRFRVEEEVRGPPWRNAFSSGWCRCDEDYLQWAA
jgi:hypothetical protein